MVTIKLHNTRTRTKEIFTPIDANNVRMYVCGPTVYDRAHLGNARPVVVFDVLYRLLRHVYGADHVTYVRNFTDVDDKINATAQARKAAGDPRSLEALIFERTEETIGWYHADMDALGALRPDAEPRATEFISQMVSMIEGLIASGHAYAVQGHVLFRVRSYTEYGALSGRTIDDMIAGARVEVAPFKEDPMDFVLWKPSDADLPGWPSPWGKGRPGWHIECSAMAEELLWKKPKAEGRLSEAGLRHPHAFDIHGGGLDLQFPHHENEIAQSACSHPGTGFANVWMHNEMLQVEGRKMSKSLGNFFTVRELLDDDVPGLVMRYMLLGTHYRKPTDWQMARVEPIKKTLKRWARIEVESGEPHSSVIEALCDDLNTHQAISALHRLEAVQEYASLKGSLEFLGFDLNGILEWPTKWGLSSAWDNHVGHMIAERERARIEKNFVRADFLREGLKAAGVVVRDLPTGPEWELADSFDLEKLEALK